jgi:hypothetical protein
MYVITNPEAISAVIDNNAPRDVTTVLREMYPSCTIDNNGRAHAPWDGYQCAITSLVYRGGEYLPESDEAVVGGSQYRMFTVNANTNEEVIFEGTKAQITAAREIAKQQQAIFDASTDFVGEIKKRQMFDLRICAVFHNVGMYGDEFTHLMRDENMNPVVYKGSKRLGKSGANLLMKATVKNHWLSQTDSRKATYVARPALA